MKRLEELRIEFADVLKDLSNPLTVEDFIALKARRNAIISEAKDIAKSCGLVGPSWLDANCN